MGAPVSNDGLFTIGQVVTRKALFLRPNDATQYTAGDTVADSTTVPTYMLFKDVVTKAGGSGCIQGALLAITASVAALQPDLQLYLYDTRVPMQADNVAFASSNAQIQTLVAVISFPVSAMVVTNSGAGAAGNVICNVQGMVIPFNTAADDTNLYGHLVVRNAYTPVASTAFAFRLNVVN